MPVAAYNGGYDVLIVDSLSHAWAGKDGALELVDRASATGRDNRFTAWRHVTPLHNKLVDTMLRLPMHLIVTLRTKVAYVIEEDARGKHMPRKVGMAPMQREGCEYEFDVIGELHNTVLTISKTRLRFLQGLVLESDPRDPITPGRELGRRIAADLGSEPEAPASPPAVEAPVQQVEPREIKKLWALIREYEVNHDAFRDYLTQQIGIRSTKELSPEQLETCISEIETWQGQAFQVTEPARNQDLAEPQGTRTHLFEALTMLQAEIAQAEQTQPPGEPYAQALMELAQWVPRVGRACEHPDTPEDQLNGYLLEVNQALAELRAMMTEAAA
ncbi:MAG: ATP-binding protein [Candidatus Tectomicrobia bacterium]|nr:ATP-binding protein [Candidatus Tectomicrobia bacterium]